MEGIIESIEYLDLMSKEINASINNYRIYKGHTGYFNC